MAVQDVFEFCLDWHSEVAAHRERQVLCCDLAAAQDAPVAELRACLAALATQGSCSARFAAGELVPPHAAEQVRQVPLAQFDARFAGQDTPPEVGRYYPRAILAAALGGSKRDLAPFLVTRVEQDLIEVDLNHPLARFDLALSAFGRDLDQPPQPVLRSAAAVVGRITANGPGMQGSAAMGAPTMFAVYPFVREDERADRLFYATERLVAHLDVTASAEIAALYARFLRPGMKVLDLMSSWMSHLPDSPNDLRVVGLGMNEAELGANPRLCERVVHDLNQSPVLPFQDGAFDLVVCTASIEYLVRPVEVLQEVGRVLKPGAVFVNTFSNRWFPPKAIRLWAHLHPFERLGLVLNAYRRAAVFEALNTETLQGLPRPRADKYAGRLATSDPVFAVWGRRAQAMG